MNLYKFFFVKYKKEYSVIIDLYIQWLLWWMQKIIIKSFANQVIRKIKKNKI